MFLLAHYSFVWQFKLFFGVPVPRFGLAFGTWHVAISHSVMTTPQKGLFNVTNTNQRIKNPKWQEAIPVGYLHQCDQRSGLKSELQGYKPVL